MLPGVIPNLAAHIAYVTKRVFLTTTGAGSVVLPWDFNPYINMFECIAGGGAGYRCSNSFGAGAAGGMYAKKSNVFLLPGTSIPYSVGVGGIGVTTATIVNGGDTWIGDTVYSNSFCGAKGGPGGNTTVGGAAPSTGGIGDLTFAGGSGGPGATPNSGAGGGAGGSNGTGATAANPNGGTGGGSSGGTGGLGGNTTTAQDGGSGGEWDTMHGSGGGGGSYNVVANIKGKNGGLYGGGGAGSRGSGTAAGGDGGQGLILITYLGIV